MQRLLTIAFVTGISLAAFSSCSNDPTLTGGANTTGSNITFAQIDTVGKPGVNELFATYAEHDANNRSTALAGAALLAPEINTFVTGFAGRSAATSAYLQALFTPGALLADLSQNATAASYLGYETSGQIADQCAAPNFANTFGGRGLFDDVAATDLGLVFGSTASHLSATPNVNAPVPPDDGNEQDGRTGRPNLANDNVGCGAVHVTLGQFPYLGAPI
jgi:hypothetical protein